MAFYVCSHLPFLMIIAFIFFTCRCSFIKSLQASPLDDDQQALLQIKQQLSASITSVYLTDWIASSNGTNTTPNPASTNTSSANTSSSINSTSHCGWSRVTCSYVGTLTRVTGLDLSSLSISGKLITGFSNLSSLSSLNLSHNTFAGSISEDIASSTQLTSLDLSNNNISSLSGPGLSSLSNLQSLNLGENKITAPSLSLAIPVNCLSLLSLNLSNNFFMDLSSFSWQNCTSLHTLDLSHNQFTGSLPTNLTSLPSLSHLAISSNQLVSSIPSSLCSIKSSLTHLDVSDNQLNGTFPFFLTNCSSLRHLDLSGNKLTGELSSQIGNFSALQVINLSENLFTGPIPAELGKLITLKVFMAGSNRFVGNISAELSNCKSLELLDLNANNLEGNLPDFFNQMPSLEYLVLHSNKYAGSIPSSLFNASKVRFLDLSNNTLSGSISSQFFKLSSLQFLLLADNQFSGEIPSELGTLSALIFLDLSSNKLQGSIPSSLGQLQDLLWLMLAHNNLTGEIPTQLGNCTSLLWLNLKNNSLTGEIPAELATMGRDPQRVFDINAKTINPPKALGECLMLKRWIPEDYPPYSFMYDNLDKSRCKSFWIELLTKSPLSTGCSTTQRSGGYIQVTENMLTGSIPSNLQGNQTSMLLLSMNFLNGNLPGVLGQLPLRNLNVSHNRFSGPIPSSLADNRCLTLLDLSYNNLSGSLPPSLGNLSQLSSFNVSYNPLLSGSIPATGQLLTFGPYSYVNDNLLCFEPVVGMRENTTISPMSFCSSTNSTTQDITSTSTGTDGLSTKNLLAIGILTSSVVLLCAVLGFYMVWRWAKVIDRCHTSQDDVFGCIDKCKENETLSSSQVHSTIYMFERGPLAPCPSLKQLTYADILLATNNFSEENVVGCGGFGIVYKAKLVDGSTVAIKKLVHNGYQGDREFMAEMETLGSIMQENLVPLLGCCVFGAEKLLVYKYLSNGSLEDWLYDKEGGAETLTWTRRLRIASNCAKALSYLHHECTPVLIHRDMKASNVLLDEEFNGYLADFGLARELEEGDTHVSTVVAGTLGYVAPEYCQTWRATTKGDVYSFGVVMLELITGRHPICRYNSMMNAQENPNDGNLVDWVRGLFKASKAHEAFDPFVKKSAQKHTHELLKFLELAQACTLDLPEHRPSMKTVASSLESLLHIHSFVVC